MTTKSMNGTAHERHVEPPPTDLDLMLYLDGELSDERQAEVRRALSTNEVLRNKLAALEMSSDIVRESALDSAANVDFADAIMAKIFVEKDVARDERDACPAPIVNVAPVVDHEPVRLEKLPKRANPSNDNARGIFALAALAVAAAAGLMIWGRMAPSVSSAPSAPVAMVTTPEIAPVVASPDPQQVAPNTEEVAAEEQEDVGVEVAAVDFGSKVGTIFYVPAEAATSKHTTTVIWLTDPDEEEK